MNLAASSAPRIPLASGGIGHRGAFPSRSIGLGNAMGLSLRPRPTNRSSREFLSSRVLVGRLAVHIQRLPAKISW